jgi:hypothetical protein
MELERTGGDIPPHFSEVSHGKRLETSDRPATTHIGLSGLTADEPFTRPFSFAVSDWTDRIGTSRAILWMISHSSPRSFKQCKQWTADGRLAHFAPNTFPAESDSSADGFVFDGWVPKDPLRRVLVMDEENDRLFRISGVGRFGLK